MENNFQLDRSPENKYFDTAEYARKINSFYHRMRPKGFTERLKNMDFIAKIGIFFFPLISIITSISFLLGHFQSVIKNLYISIAIAAILLGLIEFAKNSLLTTSLDSFFSNSGKVLGTLIFAFLFSCLSFYMSFSGSEMFVKNMDNSSEEIKDSSVTQLAAIENKYNAQIAIEQSKASAINNMAPLQWHGLLNTSQTDLLRSYEGNIKDLRSLMEKEKNIIISEKAVNLDKAEKSVNKDASVFKLFAGLIELMLILSISFYEFYIFKSVRQDLDLRDFKSNPSKYNSLEPKDFKGIEASSNVQSPKISLNTNNDRSVI